MLELLATTEPQLERIPTWNVASNAHMVAVNDALGYVPYGTPVTWSQLEVATVPGPAGPVDGSAGPAAG
jgi:hypothetical protein